MLLALFISCSFPVEQREVCSRYIACIDARDARDGTTTDVARFDVDGDCWGTDRGADLCEAACTSGLSFLSERDPAAPAECAP